MRRHAAQLASGIYVKAGPRLWRLWRGRPPSTHVVRTKGWRGPRRGRNLVSDLVGGMLVIRGQGTAEIVMAAFDGGVVIVDEHRRTVSRTYGGTATDQAYWELRERLAAHVRVPAAHFDRSAGLVCEELVDGSHLLDVSPTERRACVKRVILSYESLVRHEGVERPDGLASALNIRMSGAGVSKPWGDLWREHGVAVFGEPAMHVPSAVEASAKNVIVQDDGSPVLIDLGDIREEPFFVYPIGLILAAGTEAIEHYLAGRNDPELTPLFDAAGVEWAPTRSWRLAVLLARTAYAAIRDAEHPLPGNADRTFAESFDLRWSELAPVLGSA